MVRVGAAVFLIDFVFQRGMTLTKGNDALL
jgi:hypothetical protein